MIVLTMDGAIARADVPALCERARSLMVASDAGPLVCDVGGLRAPDAVAVDALARLQLTARRLGYRVELLGVCDELRDLLTLIGLDEALPCGPRSPLEPRRQAEEREQPLAVEEEADPRDPPS